MLTIELDELAAEITERVTVVAPSLLAIVGCGALTAAEIVGETAQVRRFRSKDAFARLNGTALDIGVVIEQAATSLVTYWESAVSAALHGIAMTQARTHPPGRGLLQRRKLNGDGGMEALRLLKRRLSDVVNRAMITGQTTRYWPRLDSGARETFPRDSQASVGDCTRGCSCRRDGHQRCSGTGAQHG